jgi:hypothetical protein
MLRALPSHRRESGQSAKYLRRDEIKGGVRRIMGI